eukprot:88661-Hanusia_phi.AAC.1
MIPAASDRRRDGATVTSEVRVGSRNRAHHRVESEPGRRNAWYAGTVTVTAPARVTPAGRAGARADSDTPVGVRD